jgi:DNA-binding CsgD family transcriptional regulator
VPRVVIVSASPLLAGGLAEALSGVAEWQVSVQPEPGEADVLVTDAPEHPGLAALPPAVGLVLLGEDLHDGAARHDARPLALLSPDATPAQLRAAVAAVLAGLSVQDAGLPWRVTMGQPLAGDHEPLTPRELEVYELLGKGLSNREIGEVLGISVHTAKYHVGQILAKVGAATRAEAVSAGLRMGIIGL